MPDRGAVSEREQTILGIIETARGKRAKFRDKRITMAHGAGGKATQGLIEGLHDVVDQGVVMVGGEGEEVAKHRHVRAAHDGPCALPDLDDTEHREGAQRLPEDGSADAQLGG